MYKQTATYFTGTHSGALKELWVLALEAPCCKHQSGSFFFFL